MKVLTQKELDAMDDWVGPFSEGLAAAKNYGRYFHIHPDGTPAYEQRYDWVEPFSEGLVRSRSPKGWRSFPHREQG